MKELSQEEFESKVEEIINGSISRRKLCDELQTSMRTLNNRIMELSTTNPELYKSFVAKFSYKPRKMDVGNINDLAIYVIQHGLAKTTKVYGISVRTITRKVNELKESNPELYKIYRARTKRDIPDVEIDKYKKNEAKTERTEVEEARYELTLLLSEFDRLVKAGNSKAEAARIMGYDSYPTIWKKANDYRRILTERQTREEASKESKPTIQEANKETKMKPSNPSDPDEPDGRE